MQLPCLQSHGMPTLWLHGHTRCDGWFAVMNQEGKAVSANSKRIRTLPRVLYLERYGCDGKRHGARYAATATAEGTESCEPDPPAEGYGVAPAGLRRGCRATLAQWAECVIHGTDAASA